MTEVSCEWLFKMLMDLVAHRGTTAVSDNLEQVADRVMSFRVESSMMPVNSAELQAICDAAKSIRWPSPEISAPALSEAEPMELEQGDPTACQGGLMEIDPAAGSLKRKKKGSDTEETQETKRNKVVGQGLGGGVHLRSLGEGQ
mmetsp:Transcript_14403/g.30208  ORF Transcript_14403/g.30208 Transcript_14403/m.30208 type:complete len:144 (-) Transcript_14403:13-444(-)